MPPWSRSLRARSRLASRALCQPALVLLGLAAPLAVHADSTWTDYYRAAHTAFAAGDWAGARQHFLRGDEIVGGSPNAMYNLAAVDARLGHLDSALAWLDAFAATGLVRPAAHDTLLAPLRGDPRFARVVARIDSNATPIARADVVLRLDDAGLLAEDVAYDRATATFLVSSIHRRKIIAVDRSGRTRDFTASGADGVWGVFALQLDEKRALLWATTCAVRTIDAYDSADSGRAAVLCYDARSGRLLRRVELFRDGAPHVLGDMTLGPDGSVYITDSVGGGVFALRPDAAAFDTLAAGGTFGSPQTPVLTPDGRRLLIADYPRGIASLDLRTGAVAWLAKPRTLGASGIDGLYRLGTHLLAIQNGWSVKRVLWLDLDPTFTRITGWSVLERASGSLGEPSHGVVAGGDFYFLGNTGWDRVGEDEQLTMPPGAKPPVILKLAPPRTR